MTDQTTTKFKVGMRVRMKPYEMPYIARRTGTVIDVSHGFIRIQRDNVKRPDVYSPILWEPFDPNAIVPNLCPTCGQKLP